MEIIREVISINYNISDLKTGDIFLYDDNIYMKIEELEDRDGIFLNAISLENPCGECYHFHDDDTITPLNATLKVWRRG